MVNNKTNKNFQLSQSITKYNNDNVTKVFSIPSEKVSMLKLTNINKKNFLLRQQSNLKNRLIKNHIFFDKSNKDNKRKLDIRSE